MAAPANEMLRELERVLTLAADSGEPAARASLQAELGVGGDELQSMLDELRAHGKAVEVTPGEWRGPLAEDGAAEPQPVTVSAPEPENQDELSDEQVRAWFARQDREPMAAPMPAVDMVSGATVRLTPAVADALDPEALGKLVKAGIDEAKAVGLPFILEVAT